MTGRFTATTLAIIASLLVWFAVAEWVMGESRQRCTASDDVCAWELR